VRIDFRSPGCIPGCGAFGESFDSAAEAEPFEAQSAEADRKKIIGNCKESSMRNRPKEGLKPSVLALVAALAFATVHLGFCADAPSKMTHVIAQMTGTDIPAESFAAKPKTYWRSSSQYCRVDEEPDADNNIHGRMVVNEPDAWMINLADSTARHIIDPGPTFNCRLPIFAFDLETTKGKLGELEFGRELEFFKTNGAKQIEGPKLSFEVKAYEVTVGDAVLRLVERVDIHAPIMIFLVRGSKEYRVKYLMWDDQIPFKADLFAKPAGVRITEAK
jgi:hypothetical protein